MKKLTILATVLAITAGLTAGVAGYIALNNKPDTSNVAAVAQKESASDTTSADTTEATASGDTVGAGNATASGDATAGKDTVSGEATAAANAAANEVAPADNTAISNGTANENADNATSPSVNAATNEPTTGANAEEETVGAPDAAPAAQTTSTGLDVNTAQAIHDAYVAKAPSAQGDVGRGYYIYDIDKDGIPELLLTYEEGNTRGLAVYTYVDGSVEECGVMWGFAHGLPFPASYPEGNGIVLEECARGYQCIWLISKNGTAMSDTINSDSANVFTEELRTAWPTYYTDIEDDFGYYYNHQYRAVLSPYFEGSEALSLCDPADDTAIREALGMN